MTTKRSWSNPAKDIERTVGGKCPYCKADVKNLEKHIHDRHKGAKPIKK